MMNESVKKSLEKSKNVQEQKREIVKQKICKKNTHVYNNCYELRSRAIKKGLYGFMPFLFLTLIFLYWLFILNCFAEQLLFKRTLSRTTEEWR